MSNNIVMAVSEGLQKHQDSLAIPVRIHLSVSKKAERTNSVIIKIK